MGGELLRVAGLSKSYRRRRSPPVQAVDDVSLSVAPGEIVGLLGANGAGKTTTIKCICGLVTPTAGTITIDGIDARRQPGAAAARRIAVLEGNRTVYWRLNCRENLEFAAALRGIRASAVRPQIEDLLVRFGLEDRAAMPAMKLSRGMQQKLALACAVVVGAPLLLLDEPTLGLDVEISRELRAFLLELARDHGRGILLSSHDMRVVRDVADRVVIIKDGHVVVDDRVENLLALFRARSLLVRLAAPLPAHELAPLRARFPAAAAGTTDGASADTVAVTLADATELYELVDLLRAAGAVVESIDRDEVDLEDVFIRIVGEAVSG